VRGAEGTAVVLPGRSSKRTWSEGLKNYIRNVEAEGSNPFTSTGGLEALVGLKEVLFSLAFINPSSSLKTYPHQS
jgi:hypothetical protein